MKQFTKHTLESAPEEAIDHLQYAEKKYGMLPNLIRYMASAPPALEGYMNLFNTFSKTSFSAGEQHLILLAVSIVNQCDYCTAAHSRAAKAAGADIGMINTIRKGVKTGDSRIDTLIAFTKLIVEKKGFIEKENLEEFYAAGFEPENVLEIIVGVSLKTLSNYINHITENVINEELKPFEVGKEIEA